MPPSESAALSLPTMAVRYRPELFLGLRSLYRTDAGAGAALDAHIGIDLILAVAFLNAADWTFVRASSASDAVITDLVCHFVNTSV